VGGPLWEGEDLKIKIIYPKWPKLANQPEFNLPPHGPVVFAAALSDDIEISFCDEHVQKLDFHEGADLIALSTMLTCQMPRAWEIADRYRAAGRPVVFGGIAAMLHAAETMGHADAVFIGEAEGWIGAVIEDFKKGKLKRVYDHLNDYPDLKLLKIARRDILDRGLYSFRGVQMVDLVHASRGCRFNCFPCCTPYLGGRTFRPRPIDQVAREIESIDNNRLFLVDNSLAQDDNWLKDLFKEIAPLKKKWISHPIKDDDEILDLAARAGCWYTYQAIVNNSDHIRKRIKRVRERGIGVEGTILLGLDEHDEDYIRRLVDSLLEMNLDLAEFTVLTPFPHTPIRAHLKREGRILHNDWIRYTGGEVVFQPRKMSVDSLQKMYEYAWKTFYAHSSKEIQMAKMYLRVMKMEKNDGTYKRVRLNPSRSWR
jgi:radical SAM superfamily enzyme YgiQ (UPF0313 family)